MMSQCSEPEDAKVPSSSSSSQTTLHVLIGCTGSVASVKVPILVKQLSNLKINNCLTEIKVISTESSLHFFPYKELQAEAPVLRDIDEWSSWKKISDPVVHIELRRWGDIMVIAPIDANTLAKIANGLCDNLLTCVVRAWDLKKPLLFCPAMNTYMWQHPVTAQHINKLKEFGYIEVPCIAKKLACGDIGYGGMAEVPTIVKEVTAALKNYSK